MFVYCERGARVESPVALVCFSLMTLSASSRLPYIPGMSLLKTLREICTSSTFLTWICGLGSFFQDQKFSNGLAIICRLMDKFHVEGCAQSVFFMRDACTICIICVQFVMFYMHNLLYFTCAICCTLRAQSVRDLCLIHAQSVRDLCIFLHSSLAQCFCRSRVRTPDHAARSFTGPRFDSWAWLPVSGQ